MKRSLSRFGILLAVAMAMLLAGCCEEGEVADTGETFLARVTPPEPESTMPDFGGSVGAELFWTKTCHTCHGQNGETPLLPNYPYIAGQNFDYARQQMLDIKNGVRTNGQSAAMAPIMAQVSDEEIDILADYIANETVRTKFAPPDSVNPMGKRLFRRRTCFTCHGKDGKSPIMPEYPVIAGQTKEYALQQMTDIKSGARSNGQTIAMTGIIHLVKDEEMSILAEYVSSLDPRAEE